MCHNVNFDVTIMTSWRHFFLSTLWWFCRQIISRKSHRRNFLNLLPFKSYKQKSKSWVIFPPFTLWGLMVWPHEGDNHGGFPRWLSVGNLSSLESKQTVVDCHTRRISSGTKDFSENEFAHSWEIFPSSKSWNRTDWMDGNSLWDVTQATLINKLLYASPVFLRFMDASDKQRLQSIVKSVRLDILPISQDPLSELCEHADQALFSNIVNNHNQVLHNLLPALKITGHDTRKPRKIAVYSRKFLYTDYQKIVVF